MPSTVDILGVPYDGMLAMAAFAAALATGLTMFRLRSRMRGARGMVRGAWLFLAALQGGAGIWAAQFLLTAAMHPALRIAQDPITTMAAFTLASGGALVALAVAWTGRDLLRTVSGGLLLALTIAGICFVSTSTMHVAGAFEMEPIVTWGAAIVCTIFACVAMGAADRGQTFLRQLAGGGLFALGVIAMALLSISGAHVVIDPTAATFDAARHSSVTLVVVMVTIMVVLCGLGAAYIDDTGAATALRRTRRLADAAREGIVVVGEDGSILDCNAAFCDLVGLPLGQLLRTQLLGVALELEEGCDLGSDHRLVGDVLGRNGERIPIEAYARPLADERSEGRLSTVVAIRDLRERLEAQRRIRHLSEHDVLTGLPNREALARVLEESLARVAESNETLVTISIEIANYRETNELYGVAAGDALLCKVAERLQRIATKPAFVARQTGADFTLVAFGPVGGTTVAGLEFVRWLGAKLRRPLDFGGQAIEPQILFGVSGCPHDAHTPEELLAHAAIALEQARREGEANPDGCCMFRTEIHEAMRDQRALARDLKSGISNGELVVFYQPQARVADGELSGFEALVRWKHPERGMMPPDTFIRVAEEAGLIGALGEWVLRRACADAAAWPRPLRIAVNLSPLQVSQDDLPDLVRSILFETGLSPSRLELEITESALFQNYQRSLDILRRLKAMGVHIAMDDFGTGFSSLSTLHSFPFDKIKIDKSFVEGIGKLERSTVIVRAVLGIGRGLSIPVVAEGVETVEQLDFLRAENCAELQGYHIGRPAPVEAHVELIRTGRTAASRPTPPLDADLQASEAKAPASDPTGPGGKGRAAA